MAVNSNARSIICAIIGSLIILLPSLAYLITQAVLEAKNGTRLQGDGDYALFYSIVTYTALGIFVVTGVVGIASVIDCFGGKGRKYLFGCSVLWFVWILLSIGGMIAVIVAYGLGLNGAITLTNKTPDQISSEKLLTGTWIGVCSFIMLFCLIPICCCGLERMITTGRNRNIPQEYSTLGNDDL